MNLELDPDEERALVAELKRVIRDDRYPLSRRIRTRRANPRQAGSAAGPRAPVAAKGLRAAARQAGPAPGPTVRKESEP
jgi:hypothetical protein